MTLAPRIVRAPSRAARLSPGARIEHVTCGEVAIGPLARREFRRIALFAPQTTEIVKRTSPELCVAVPTRRSEDRHEEEYREVCSICSGRNNPASCARYHQDDSCARQSSRRFLSATAYCLASSTHARNS